MADRAIYRRLSGRAHSAVEVDDAVYRYYSVPDKDLMRAAVHRHT